MSITYVNILKPFLNNIFHNWFNVVLMFILFLKSKSNLNKKIVVLVSLHIKSIYKTNYENDLPLFGRILNGTLKLHSHSN